MIRQILIFGTIAGLIVGSVLFGTGVTILHDMTPTIGMAIGYTSMLAAFSMIFIAIKRQRDSVQGGVIRFLPALGMGLGITIVAGIFYVLAWEAVLAVTGFDFMAGYIEADLAAMREAGADAAAIARRSVELNAMMAGYDNPLYRMPLTFTEIAPVGVVISLIAALLLGPLRLFPIAHGGAPGEAGLPG